MNALHGGDEDPGGALFRLDCPRCAGTIHALRDAVAVACPFCSGRFFLGDSGDVGWMMEPRIPVAELAEAARRHLRAARRRVTRLDPPRGLLLPVFWAHGVRLRWALLPPPPSGETDLPAPGEAVPWEAGFDTASYARSVPAHPLSGHLDGVTTRLDAGVLSLLDPDCLPGGYEILAARLSRTDAESTVARWQEGREHRPGGRELAAAAMNARHRMNRVAMPAALVPFAFRTRNRGAVLVDALSGRVLAVLEHDALPVPDDRVVPASVAQPTQVLLPLECACGWALALRERDVLQPCPQCGACWELSGRERRRVRQWVLEETKPAARWLPFWIFGGAGTETAPPEDAVVVPAYRARHPVAQLYLAARLGRGLPRDGWSEAWDERHTGAALGSEEAGAWHWAVRGALARETLAAFRRFLDGPPPACPEAGGLAWIPFGRAGGDLVEPRTGARVREVGTRPWRAPRAA